VGFESCDVAGDGGAGGDVDCGAGDDWGAAESGAVCARAGVKIPAQQNQRKMNTRGEQNWRLRLSVRLTVKMPMERPETASALFKHPPNAQ
jgi:hypothetical protein